MVRGFDSNSALPIPWVFSYPSPKGVELVGEFTWRWHGGGAAAGGQPRLGTASGRGASGRRRRATSAAPHRCAPPPSHSFLVTSPKVRWRGRGVLGATSGGQDASPASAGTPTSREVECHDQVCHRQAGPTTNRCRTPEKKLEARQEGLGTHSKAHVRNGQL